MHEIHKNLPFFSACDIMIRESTVATRYEMEENTVKKIFALILAVLMAFTACAALAEEEGKLAPMFATVGEALDASGDPPVTGNNEDYCSVITMQDGIWYRHIAYTDEKAKELQNAIYSAEIEELEAAFAASEEYNKTLPIAYSEAFTVQPMPQEELDALVGKTIGELRAAGYTDAQSGSDGDDVVFVMRSGLFEYAMVVDADVDAYIKATEEDETGNPGGDFVIKSAAFDGISSDACMLEYHTDGTMEEQPDPFADMTAVTAAVLEKIQAIANGEEADMEAFAAELKEQYPDMAEMIDSYLGLYKTLGAEVFISMMNSAAEDSAAPQE